MKWFRQLLVLPTRVQNYLLKEEIEPLVDRDGSLGLVQPILNKKVLTSSFIKDIIIYDGYPKY